MAIGEAVSMAFLQPVFIGPQAYVLRELATLEHFLKHNIRITLTAG